MKQQKIAIVVKKKLVKSVKCYPGLGKQLQFGKTCEIGLNRKTVREIEYT